jgi:transketolase
MLAEVSEELLFELGGKARMIRSDIIRMVTAASSGHPGGSLSSVEIVTALYFYTMRLRPDEPLWQERDRFILSKGHASPLLYAALAERGFFSTDELLSFRKLGSRLQGHPAYQKVPGVEASTGSLGQGLSLGLGISLGCRLDRKDYRVYVLLGDGENEEGQVWEAAMAAAHYHVDNLTAIIDNNNLQIDGPITSVLSPAPLPDKWRAFGWAVREVDGHNFIELLEAYEWAKSVKGQPAVIIAHTIKGKGVSFMENQAGWHGKAPSQEEADRALQEIAQGVCQQ